MTKPKVVLDTNIYLSGIIFGGNARHILDLVIAEEIIAFTSLTILLEITNKLKSKFRWQKDQIIAVIQTISQTASLIAPKQKLQVVKADKDDNKIIEAAVEAKADFIISGDKHLLEMKKYQRIKIVSPSQFLTKYFQTLSPFV